MFRFWHGIHKGSIVFVLFWHAIQKGGHHFCSVFGMGSQKGGSVFVLHLAWGPKGGHNFWHGIQTGDSEVQSHLQPWQICGFFPGLVVTEFLDAWKSYGNPISSVNLCLAELGTNDFPHWGFLRISHHKVWHHLQQRSKLNNSLFVCACVCLITLLLANMFSFVPTAVQLCKTETWLEKSE